MPRSEYVYVVLNVLCGTSIAATFTVKREMVRWLGQKTEDELVGLDAYRCHDGGHYLPHKPVKLDLKELLA
jgi:hypothetical protein